MVTVPDSILASLASSYVSALLVETPVGMEETPALRHMVLMVTHCPFCGMWHVELPYVLNLVALDCCDRSHCGKYIIFLCSVFACVCCLRAVLIVYSTTSLK